MAATNPSSIPSRSELDKAEGDELDSLLCALAAASSGNPKATERLLYAIDSRRLAEPGIRKILFDPADVKDVSQDVLIAVAEHAGNFRGESRFTSWLLGLARNKAIDHLRRKRDSVQFTEELGDAERISSLIINDISIQELLAELPDHYRMAVTMRDVQGMAYADIATHLDLNLNTTRSHIARGRALVAARVQAMA